ncbi:MAG: thioredoxin family protein [Erysipelotrichaceae bacterium]
MKKIMMIACCLLLLVGCSKKDTPVLTSTLTFDELEEKIQAEETMIVFFGWLVGCGDTVNFQENYLRPMMESQPNISNMEVVDLDVEVGSPSDKSLRTEMIERFNVTYGPTIVAYENGVEVERLEWTPATTDATYGIPKSQSDAFFETYGLIVK